jgi:hypothetical protein
MGLPRWNARANADLRSRCDAAQQQQSGFGMEGVLRAPVQLCTHSVSDGGGGRHLHATLHCMHAALVGMQLQQGRGHGHDHHLCVRCSIGW